jgi:serine/threonine protein kinase
MVQRVSMGDDPRVGTELAGYRILEVIGSGGASVVYLAVHSRLGRDAALKVLTSPLAHDAAFRERFIRESQIAAGLDHPNIVPVYDAGEADGVLYLAMRYIKGSDLGQTVRREGPLDPWRVIAILSDVASALDSAHAEGLVHRDVKPGNILLTRDRATGIERAFLADFGLTKRLASSGGGLTHSGQFVGTVDYVAPEQILGEPVDGRADGYSLACVLFLALTGKPPFPRPNDVGTIYAHVHEPPPHLTADGTTKLDRVIARGLAKDRNDRYGTCSSLVEAARSALQAEPETLAGIPAIPTNREPEGVPSTEEPPTVVVNREPTKEASPPGTARTRRARPTPVRVAGAAAVLLVVAAALLFSINRGEDPNDPPGSTPSRTGPTSSGSEELESTWQNIGPFQSDLSQVDEQEKVIAAAPVPGGGLLGVGHADPSAVDEDPAVWSSPNGFDWTRVDADALRAPGSQRMVDVIAFEDAYVAVGYTGDDAAVWASDTGATGWHLVDTIEEPGMQVMREIVESDGTLQVVGWQSLNGEIDAAAWRSEDGLTWERVPDPELEGAGIQEMWTALRVDGTVIGLGTASDGSGGTDAAVWQQDPDGWTRLDLDLTAPGDQEIRDVALSREGTIVAVGITSDGPASDGGIWTSDASALGEWEVASGRFPTPLAQELLAVVATDRGFVAMGWTTREGSRRDGWIWTSPDGQRWSEVEDRGTVVVFGGPQTQEVRSLIAFGTEDDPKLAALGTSGTANENAEVWIGTPRR